MLDCHCCGQVQMSLEECVADFAKVIKVIRLMMSTAIQLVVTLTGLTPCFVALRPSVRLTPTVGWAIGRTAGL